MSRLEYGDFFFFLYGGSKISLDFSLIYFIQSYGIVLLYIVLNI